MCDIQRDCSALALEGVELVLNNQIEEAKKLFLTHQDSIQVAAGYCYFSFMNALMTFEEEKLQETLALLKGTERRCLSSDGGIFGYFRNKVFGRKGPPLTGAEIIEQQIIAADCQVLAAILTFLQQDLGSYIRGGWQLRKAWSKYHALFALLRSHYLTTFGSTSSLPTSPDDDWSIADSELIEAIGSDKLVTSKSQDSVLHSSSIDTNQRLSSVKQSQSEDCLSLDLDSVIPPDVLARLLGAVCFGYGVFQLSVSLLPPQLLTVIHFLGFQGNRAAGLNTLAFARKGRDMRAPFATLALLWYHTIVRPFFSLDGSNIKAGVEQAQNLLHESKSRFEESAIFLFFTGRTHRLKSNISLALESYQRAASFKGHREMELLCLHEIGWCQLILLNWKDAHKAFITLKHQSRWSKSYYAYLAAVSIGATDQLDAAVPLLKEVPTLVRQKSNQLEAFILRRAHVVANDQGICSAHYRLYIMELLFLWNAIPACTTQHLQRMLIECSAVSSPSLISLRRLIEGAVHTSLGDYESAEEAYRNCIAVGSLQNTDCHVPAYASYELGLLLSQKPEALEEGVKFLEQARDNFENYDFQNRLSIRIHSALKSMCSS